MADISGLTNLQATEPLDWEGYTDAQESKPIPPAGRYQFQVCQTVTFPPAASGFLQAQIDPVIVGPTQAGYVVKQTKVSTKPFARGTTKVSFAADVLRAVGLPVRPNTPQEFADALEQTAGLVFQGDLDWEAGRRNDPWYTKGMLSFPKDAAGNHIPWVPKKDASGAAILDPISGEPEMERGYARIVRYVPRG